MLGFTELSQQVSMVIEPMVTVRAHRLEPGLSGWPTRPSSRIRRSVPITAARYTFLDQMRMHRTVTIWADDTTTDLLNPGRDDFVVLATRRGLRLAPAVVSAPRAHQRFTHLGTIKALSMFLHELVSAHSSLAK